jgi:hypothetical protein
MSLPVAPQPERKNRASDLPQCEFRVRVRRSAHAPVHGTGAFAVGERGVKFRVPGRTVAEAPANSVAMPKARSWTLPPEPLAGQWHRRWLEVIHRGGGPVLLSLFFLDVIH